MGLALRRKKRRASSPAEPPPPHCRCCPCSTHALSQAASGDGFRVASSLPVHSRLFVSLESLRQLDRGHPLLTTFFDYPIYLTEPSVPFGLSAPVTASVSSEANSRDRRGNSLTPSDPQPRSMPNASPLGLGQLAPHKADAMPNWPNKSESVAETFS